MNSKETTIVSNYKWLFLAALLIQASLIFSFAVTPCPLLVIQSLILTCLFLSTIFSVQKTFLFLIIYISILPSFGWGSGYSIFNLYASPIIIFSVLFLIILYWISKRFIADSYTETSITPFGSLVLLFFCVIFFSAMMGFSRSFPLKFIFRELAYLSLYPLGYLVVFFNFKKDKWIRWFWIVIVGVSLISAFEYMWLVMSGSGSYGITRVVTQQTHLTQLSIPFLIASLALYPSQKRTLFPIIMLFPLFMMVFISQQRGLWVGTLISLVILFFLSLSKKGEGRKKAILIFIIVASLSFLILTVIKKLFSAFGIATLMMRALTFRNLSLDPSLMIRWIEIGRAWEQCKDFFIIGTGLGSNIRRAAMGTTITWDTVDNSYFFLIWKTGILGLLIYLTMVFIFLKDALFVFKKDQNVEHQIIAASSIAGFIGLMAIAFTNSCLVMYRFNVIWASLFAIVEILKEKQLRIDSGSLSLSCV